MLFSLPSKPRDGERLAEKPVFVDGRGKPVTADRAYRRFKAAARAARIEGADRLRFHDLRHSTPYMTQRYAHIADRELDAMADGLTGTISAQVNASRQGAQQSQSSK